MGDGTYSRDNLWSPQVWVKPSPRLGLQLTPPEAVWPWGLHQGCHRCHTPNDCRGLKSASNYFWFGLFLSQDQPGNEANERITSCNRHQQTRIDSCRDMPWAMQKFLKRSAKPRADLRCVEAVAIVGLHEASGTWLDLGWKIPHSVSGFYIFSH